MIVKRAHVTLAEYSGVWMPPEPPSRDMHAQHTRIKSVLNSTKCLLEQTNRTNQIEKFGLKTPLWLQLVRS